MFYGDGVITPAISVLGAVEGLEVISRRLHRVIPLTLLMLTWLFAVQRFGTAGIGKFFGPVTWCGSGALPCWGCRTSCTTRIVLVALTRTTRWASCTTPGRAFMALGAVVLCVTGAEALYADLGHFGKRPIRLAWFGW
jgi:KUP system potassium uptake protein